MEVLLSKDLLEKEQPIFICRNLSINIYLPRSKYVVPYIYVTNHDETKFARLSCVRAEYVNPADIKNTWILSDFELDQLMKLVSEKLTWKYIIDEFLNYSKPISPISVPCDCCPDYTKIVQFRHYIIHQGYEHYNFHLSKILKESYGEQSLIFSNIDLNYMILTFRTIGYKDPYFIVYNSGYLSDFTSCCRILCYSAKYLNLDIDMDVKKWIPSDEIINDIAQKMGENSKHIPHMTNWEYCIDQYMCASTRRYNTVFKPKKPMPDYTQLMKGE